MRSIQQFCLLALCVSVAYAKFSSSDFTDEERWQATVRGTAEAQEYVQKMEKKAAETAKAASSSPATPKDLLRFFRKASEETIAMGKARLIQELAVKRAERILLDKKRVETATVASKEEQAEVIAQELYHKPGSILAEKEFAHIFQASNCRPVRPGLDCAMIPFYHSVRQIPGTCNNLQKPTQGASMTPFRRLIPAHYANGIDTPVNQISLGFPDKFLPPHPSARMVSKTSITDRVLNDSMLTHLIMQWGQFMDHDLDLSVEFDAMQFHCDLVQCITDEFCLPIPVVEDDEVFGVGTGHPGLCHEFLRTIPECRTSSTVLAAREHVNELTHYIDGSNVYGSTDSRATFLRDINGLLQVSGTFPNENLPIRSGQCPPAGDCCPANRGFDQGCFVAGDTRAIELVSLTVIHTIFVREHNRVARALASLNPQWLNDRIYYEARDIVIAEIQHITFTEYLPALYGTQFDTLIGPYSGYNPNVDASIPNSFATAAYRFGHSQIQPVFERLNPSLQSIRAGPLSLVDSFFSPSEFTNGEGVSPMVRGWLHQPARAVDEFVNSVLTSQLFETPTIKGLDLATLNIQRGRDHGLARYGVWRQFCMDLFIRAIPASAYDFRNELTEIRLLQLYGSVDNIDLFIGALAETPLPGSVLGPTLACIFSLTFRNLRAGDRFWYENPDISVDLFTPEQRAEFQQVSLSRIICDNTNVGEVQPDAFMQASVAGNSQELCPFLFSTGIDLTSPQSPFREDPFCYYRLLIGTAETTALFPLSRLTSQNNGEVFEDSAVAVPGSNDICIAYTCPAPGDNTIVVASVIRNRRQFCTVQTGRNPNFFSTRISTNDLQISGNGIFGSLNECQTNSDSLVSISCDSVPVARTANKKVASTMELENDLAKVLQTGGGTVGPTAGPTVAPNLSDFHKLEKLDPTNPNIPPDAMDALLNPPTATVEARAQTKQTVEAEKSETKMDETEKLIDLLQATLQELEHKD